uniref:Uncharacterized protein n=1 Tax=Anguilla anguilla TaxID=7936 RepID=A0A0E9RWY8_ANGAN
MQCTEGGDKHMHTHARTPPHTHKHRRCGAIVLAYLYPTLYNATCRYKDLP